MSQGNENFLQQKFEMNGSPEGKVFGIGLWELLAHFGKFWYGVVNVWSVVNGP